MRKSMLLGSGLAACVLALAPVAFAQGGYTPPKTSWGAPDLQGYWTNSSITKMTRPGGIDTLVITPEQAKKLEDGDYNNIRTAAEKAPTNQTEGAPEKGKPLPPVGNYNAVWVDPGAHVAVINGELRSSWITEPANGKIPYKPGKGSARYEAPPTPAGTPPPAVSQAERSYEGPESRSVGERCIVGFGNTGGPVMNNVLYNNTYQIVQTPGAVMIDVEMMHDARVIRIGETQKPEALKQWLGDSTGRWDGDTLVVVTKNWNRWHGDYEPVFLSEKATVTERFTRTGKDEITYQFEIDDPGFYSQPWKGEMVFTPSNGPVYEYACHEGNYALEHILQGARVRDAKAK